MKGKNIFLSIIMIVIILMVSGCSRSVIKSNMEPSPQLTEQIYLYGELHNIEKILDKELELWYEYYHNESMRHLFVELPYYSAEFLNLWMQSDSDEILQAVYEDWSGSLTYSPLVKEFYKQIKSQCPETIFHGTDVGHQYQTTGKRFLEYLKIYSLEDSEQYLLAKEAIDQGMEYYNSNNDMNSDDKEVYRENMMVENFIREFDKLSGVHIMGIYGSAHTGLEQMDDSNSVPCMANQLTEFYGENVHSEDLSSLAKN